MRNKAANNRRFFTIFARWLIRLRLDIKKNKFFCSVLGLHYFCLTAKIGCASTKKE